MQVVRVKDGLVALWRARRQPRPTDQNSRLTSVGQIFGMQNAWIGAHSEQHSPPEKFKRPYGCIVG